MTRDIVSVKLEEDAEQKKADEGIDFEFSQMEEDDIDLLEPSRSRMRKTLQLPTKWRVTK